MVLDDVAPTVGNRLQAHMQWAVPVGIIAL